MSVRRFRRGEAKPSHLSVALDEMGVGYGEEFLVIPARALARRRVSWLREPEAHARSEDPDTSHKAARSVKDIRTSQRAVLDVLVRNGPLTDEQIAEHYPSWGVPVQSPSGLRTRRSELAHDYDPPLVIDTGERRAMSTGREAIVWAASEHAPAFGLATQEALNV